MSDKIETQKIDVPVIEGTKVVFLATVCVGKDGRAAIAYNASEGVNIVKVGQALAVFGSDIAKRGISAVSDASEA